MTDENAEVSRFPRDLRDYISAHVASYGFLACWCSLLLAQKALLTNVHESALIGMILGFTLSVFAQAFVWWSSTSYRMLGLTVPASSALFVGLGLGLFFDRIDFLEGLLIWGGAFGGVFASALYQNRIMYHDPDANEWIEPYRRERALYSVVASIPLAVMGVVVLLYGIGSWQSWPLLDAFWFQSFTKWYFFALATILCVWCWLRLFRPFFELCCESFFWFPYAVRVFGPGVTQIPPVGPLLVISNHASWFDPLFLAKFIPRPITPMMTESFYKLWFLRPILKHVFHVIVVRESVVRREAPELQQAIEALSRGECVVLFPEGYLRRKVDVELRRFAQGVWRILLAAPNTPVMACWIEGAWGTKYSWRNGPPGKNKCIDFRTPIRVGFSSPEIVSAQVMSDSMATRIYLMNQVSNARTYVELEPLAQFETTPLVERRLQTAQDEELT